MRKIIILIIILIFIPLKIFGFENEIELNFSNDRYQLEYDEYGNVIPKVEGFLNLNTIYDKSLPKKNIKVLIPPNSKFLTYKIFDLDIEKLNGKFKIKEGEKPYLMGEKREYNYNFDNFKIDKPIIFLSENNEKGVKFLTFTVYPFLYENGELSFVKNFKLKIYLTYDNVRDNVYKIDDNDFINGNQLYSYYKNLIKEESYDYLIITVDSLYKLLVEHKIYLESKGIKVKLVKLSNISSGMVTPEKIRDFIKREYKSSGFKYLL
ncbi:MAG: hypothetical protein H5U37_02070, partial [Caldisericia bacterium]|nr:hypothetical protein [Caldisericia bacterium]